MSPTRAPTAGWICDHVNTVPTGTTEQSPDSLQPVRTDRPGGDESRRSAPGHGNDDASVLGPGTERGLIVAATAGAGEEL